MLTIQSGDTGQQIPFFDSCQIDHNMSIRMSTIKLNTDSICLAHLANNAWSLEENNASTLQENSQSEPYNKAI